MAVGDPKDDLIKLGALLLVMFGLWVFLGGPNAQKNGGLLRTLVTDSNEERPDRTSASQSTAGDNGLAATPTAQVLIQSTAGARATLARQEYIRLRTETNKRLLPVSVTGYRLKSARTGRTALVGAGVENPFMTSKNILRNIVLKPGDQARVITGSSPFGFSFRLNKCIGYLNQVYDMTPALPATCPDPGRDHNTLIAAGLTDFCITYISGLPRCEIPSIPQEYAGTCRAYILKHYGYNNCVAKHQNDPDFFSNEWWIYLNQGGQLWEKNSDIIQLINTRGQLVDEVKY